MSGTWPSRPPRTNLGHSGPDEGHDSSSSPVPRPSSQVWSNSAFLPTPISSRFTPSQPQFDVQHWPADDDDRLDDFDRNLRDYVLPQTRDLNRFHNGVSQTADFTDLNFYAPGIYGNANHRNANHSQSFIPEPQNIPTPRSYFHNNPHTGLRPPSSMRSSGDVEMEDAHVSSPSEFPGLFLPENRAKSQLEPPGALRRTGYTSASRPAVELVDHEPEESFIGQGILGSCPDNNSLPVGIVGLDSSPLASATPVVQGIPLVSVRQALSQRLRAVFPFDLFNAVQSKCFNPVYNTNDNVVVAAPTGSGKTAILELAICKLALQRGNENFKIVYQAPTKALCSERARDWEKKFSHMSLKCVELTGDTSQTEMRRVGDASIIVTTPEKWDSITRKWHDHQRLLQMVELFLIDEVHILKDVRGATLEAVVSRMKSIGANVRFVALSATVPNSDDIATWLGRNHTTQHLPAHRETFGEEFRPVKLEKFVYSYGSRVENDFAFEKLLDSKLPTVLEKHACNKPIIVFCFTRKSCQTTAEIMTQYASNNSGKRMLWPMPSKRIAVANAELHEAIRFGVAFHHAGLDVQDRQAVEKSFLEGQIGVICCTSTLAVGVNLPCHTAILKGTVAFGHDNNVQELSDIEVMQMLGRAGRPQFDDSATAIILTRSCNKDRYERMVSGQETIESTLHLNLIEHLNSEVCLGTIRDLSSAKLWLSGTFLTVRMRRNPKHYQLTDVTSNPSLIDNQLEEICERDITRLQEAELVTHGQTIKSTDYGRAMSRYMVEFTTMKSLLQIPQKAGMETLITILSHASEFRDLRLKPGERPVLRDINQSPLLMYPLKEGITQTWHKVFLLVQAYFGHIQYWDTPDGAKLKRQLMIEKALIFERMQRLVRAVIDCKGQDRDAVSVKTALELARTLSAEAWEGRATQLTQVPGIGPAGMRKLASKGIRTVQQLAEKETYDIERLMSRQPPFGHRMKAHLDVFPRLSLNLTMTGHKLQPWKKEEPVVITATATIRYMNHKTPEWSKKSPMLTFIAESEEGTLLYFWRGSIRKVDPRDGLQVKFSAGVQALSQRIFGHLSCEEIVGTMVTSVLQNGAAADATLPPTEESLSNPSHVNGNDSQDFMADDSVEDLELIEAAERAVVLASTFGQGDNSSAHGRGQNVNVNDSSTAEKPQRNTLREDDIYMQVDDDHEDNFEYSIGDSEPVQLPNGKWRCNHACSGDARTKAGKPCTHKCCKDGLDKPRKRPVPRPKKRTAEEMNIRDTIEAVGVPSTVRVVESRPASGLEPKRQKLAIRERQAGGDLPVVNPAQEPTAGSSSDHLRAKYPKKKTNFDNVTVECIDLSNVDDECGRSLQTQQRSPLVTRTHIPKASSRGGSGFEPASNSPDAGSHKQHRAPWGQPSSQGPNHGSPMPKRARKGNSGSSQRPLVAPFFFMPSFPHFLPPSSPTLDLNEEMGIQYAEQAVLAERTKPAPEVIREGLGDIRKDVLYRENRKDPTWVTEFPRRASESLTAVEPKLESTFEEWDDYLLDGSLLGFPEPSDGDDDLGKPESSSSAPAAGDAGAQGVEVVDLTPIETNKTEPNWAADFDEDLLDHFRGYVRFV